MTGRTTTRGVSRKKPTAKSANSKASKVAKTKKTTKVSKPTPKTKAGKTISKTTARKVVAKKSEVKKLKSSAKASPENKTETPITLTKTPALRLKEKVVLLSVLIDQKLESTMYHVARTGGVAMLIFGLLMTSSALAQFNFSGDGLTAQTAGSTTPGNSSTTPPLPSYDELLTVDSNLIDVLTGDHNIVIESNYGYPTNNSYLKEPTTGTKIYLDLIAELPNDNKAKYKVSVANAVEGTYTLFATVNVNGQYKLVQAENVLVKPASGVDPVITFSDFPNQITDLFLFRIDFQGCFTPYLNLTKVSNNKVYTLPMHSQISDTAIEYKIKPTQFTPGEYYVKAYCHTSTKEFNFKSRTFTVVNDTYTESTTTDKPTENSDTSTNKTNEDSDDSKSEVSETDKNEESVDPIKTEPTEITSKTTSSITLDSVRSTERYKVYKIVLPQQSNKVTVWLRSVVSDTPNYQGLATHVEANRYAHSLDTRSIPDGTYYLYAMTDYAGASILTNKEKVVINKLALSAPAPIKTTETNSLTLDADINKQKVIETVNRNDVVVIKEYEDRDRNITEESTRQLSDNNEEASKLTLTLLKDHKVRIDKAIANYTTALRSGDEIEIEKARHSLLRLKEVIMLEAYKMPEAHQFISDLEILIERTLLDYQEKTKKIEEIIYERSSGDISKDTDGDGISDYDEVKIYGTDPTNPDSDNDGFLDGAEILNGFDPNNNTYEATINFRSPKETGVERSDILSVETISPVKLVKNPELVTKDITEGESEIYEDLSNGDTVMFTGRALPNSYVTLYIFSTPVVVTIKTKDDGSWAYTFDKELEDGSHEVYVGITDNTGSIIAKSKPFAFVKEAQAFTPVDADVAATTIAPSNDSSSQTNPFPKALIAGLTLLISGLILVMLGQNLKAMRSREEEELIVQA
ncbi:hypothetical protein KC723_00100 [Candidatus Kaiserbacteria bacterium]|nr:hypothetical protein [Candidatus Kaiserbacteria bacterium]